MKYRPNMSRKEYARYARYKRIKAYNQKIYKKFFDYITWGLFQSSFFFSIIFAFFCNVTAFEYVIYLDSFFLSINLVMLINLYRNKEKWGYIPKCLYSYSIITL
jgi:hypothetical protein